MSSVDHGGYSYIEVNLWQGPQSPLSISEIETEIPLEHNPPPILFL